MTLCPFHLAPHLIQTYGLLLSLSPQDPWRGPWTLLRPDTKLTSSNLDGLIETKYKVYLSDAEFEDVAAASPSLFGRAWFSHLICRLEDKLEV